jgi:hypothetical protein
MKHFILYIYFFIMKEPVLIVSLLLMSVILASCGGASNGPLTEAQQAESYGMSVAEFKEQKNAAASMNMTIQDHLKMSDTSGGMDMNMDMSDDSSMIEDDSDMSGMNHTMSDGTMMDNDEMMSGDSTHTMDDGTVMKDSEMHMEMMHEGDDTPEHGSDKH